MHTWLRLVYVFEVAENVFYYCHVTTTLYDAMFKGIHEQYLLQIPYIYTDLSLTKYWTKETLL